jgi:hypothetical protein
MRLPYTNATYSARVRYGSYVARRLRRAKLSTMATDVEKVTANVLLAGRAVEDADKPIQDAMADRDAADDDLDEAAQEARAKLAGRSADAARSAPYTLIFTNGIGYYIAAPLDEEVQRYGELKQRLAAHLPAGDKVRVKAVAAIDAGLGAFTAATAALGEARTAQALASTALASATEAWEKQMEKVYGALVSEVGKVRAERFFPQPKAAAKKGKVGAEDAPA